LFHGLKVALRLQQVSDLIVIHAELEAFYDNMLPPLLHSQCRHDPLHDAHLCLWILGAIRCVHVVAQPLDVLIQQAPVRRPILLNLNQSVYDPLARIQRGPTPPLKTNEVAIHSGQFGIVDDLQCLLARMSTFAMTLHQRDCARNRCDKELDHRDFCKQSRLRIAVGLQKP
jgi:hypothetical protein